MNTLKIIFLDVDGVMNCIASTDEVEAIRKRCPNFPESHPIRHTPSSSGNWFAPWSVAALNLITDTTGAHIVISSTWRESAIVWLRRWGVRGHIIGQTPVLDRFNGTIYVSRIRGDEIAAWFDKWSRVPGNRPVSSFVILDDDADMGPLLPRLVRTSHFTRGLTMEHAQLAIERLKEEVQPPETSTK